MLIGNLIEKISKVRFEERLFKVTVPNPGDLIFVKSQWSGGAI